MKTSSFFICFIVFVFNTHAEDIGHECGFAYIQLKKKPLYYQKKYNDNLWGLSKTRLLLEKQRNRGQDGAGVAAIHHNSCGVVTCRLRATKPNALDTVFEQAFAQEDIMGNSHIFLGHLRYATYGGNDQSLCQPFFHSDHNPKHRLTLAGNFNLTNIKTIKQSLPLHLSLNINSDTKAVLKRLIHHFQETKIENNQDINRTLQNATHDWDGGYAFCGVLGTGETFLFRDPQGIRPGFLYENDEVIAAASERAALIGAFDCDPYDIKPLIPGAVSVIDNTGVIQHFKTKDKKPYATCSFETIYFSRQEDPIIYQKRKNLGYELAPRVLKELSDDIENTVFCYIPNTGSVAFSGMMEKIERKVIQKAFALSQMPPTIQKEPLINKNQKLRTFIHEGSQSRKNLIEHMYNTTHGIVKPHQTIVALDDSIVRGMTLQNSIIKQLIKLNPKRIIIVSSAPPVKYPDCYGVDMSRLDEFIGFRALVSLINKHGYTKLFKETEEQCAKCVKDGIHVNPIQQLYNLFSHEQLEDQIAYLVRPSDTSWNGEIKIIYQKLDAMHKALHDCPGDWYFSGNYPTTGGYEIVNKSYLQWRMGSKKRSYE